MNFPFTDIIPALKDVKHSDSYYDDIKVYAERLSCRGIPVIFSLPHLCMMASVNIRKIINICESDRVWEYRRFKLKKKSGGYRVIHTPQDELKHLQSWILVNILEKIPSHESCKGFDKETSIKVNADTHIGANALLKMDLLRFYDSITEKRIYGIFKSLGYHPNLAVSLAKICTFVPDGLILQSFKKKEKALYEALLKNNEGILAQGAPSSPKISNLVCQSLDRRLKGLAHTQSLNYSRYADDLTFSGDYESLKRIKPVVSRIVHEEHLFVNHSKTQFIKKGGKFFVTGINVDNNKSTVPRKFKKKIEHHLYHCNKNGVEAHIIKCKINNRNFKQWLLGNIAFVFSIEEELGQKYFDEFNKILWPI